MAAALEARLTTLPLAVQIKNTFIHVMDSDEDDTPCRLMMTSVKTQPVQWTSFSESFDLSTDAEFSPRSRLLSEGESTDGQFSTTCRPASRSFTNFDNEFTSEASMTDSDCPSTDVYQLGEMYALKVVTKNTFFDVDFHQVDFHEAQDGKPIFTKTRTEPVGLFSSRSFESSQDSVRNFESHEGIEGVEPASLHCANALGDRKACVQRDETDPMFAEKADSAQQPVIVPASDRQPEYSAGAAFHATGQCKPCAWFWRPQGCFNSTECQHCHMCNRGELRKVKKANAQLSKQQGKRNLMSGQRKDVKVAANTIALSPVPWVGLVVFSPAPALW